MVDSTSSAEQAAAEESGAVQKSEASGFTPITSQEDLDRVIAARLDRERKKFAGFDDYKAKAQRLDEIEEANKTELEKITERADKAEKKLAAYEQQEKLRTWKQEVSQETGVPAEVLAGDTLEAIKAHAQALSPLLTSSTPQRVIIPSGSEAGSQALNGDGIVEAFQKAVGAG